jgi:hypothetical protein
MLQRPTIAALASLVLGGAILAQEPTAPARPESEQQKQETPTKSAADYVRDLGSDSFRARTQAERALRGMGKQALPELQKAVADGNDAEIQWRARRLVRQIERGDTGGLARRSDADQDQGQDQGQRRPGTTRPPQWQGFDDLHERFDQLFRGLEGDFGVDIPRGRFFQDDFFRDLRDQMQDMQQHMQQMQSGVAKGQSMSMQMGPDGVRVEVKTRNEKGEEESKVYEAPDLQTFKQKYPDVLPEHGLGFGFSFGGPGLRDGLRVWRGDTGGQPLHLFTWPAPRSHDLKDQDLDDHDLAQPDAAPQVLPPAGKRLGVVVKPEIPQQVRDYLGIKGGLMVEQVQDGTLASALQLEAGDIVLDIAGTKIANTADVQQALGAIEAGKRVDVKIVRRGKELTVHADKPAAPAEATPAPLEKRNKGGAIR